MIVLLLDSERDSGEVTCMPKELDVADEIEIEETDSVVTEEDRRRTGGDDSNQEGRNQVVSQAVHYNHDYL